MRLNRWHPSSKCGVQCRLSLNRRRMTCLPVYRTPHQRRLWRWDDSKHHTQWLKRTRAHQSGKSYSRARRNCIASIPCRGRPSSTCGPTGNFAKSHVEQVIDTLVSIPNSQYVGIFDIRYQDFPKPPRLRHILEYTLESRLHYQIPFRSPYQE